MAQPLRETLEELQLLRTRQVEERRVALARLAHLGWQIGSQVASLAGSEDPPSLTEYLDNLGLAAGPAPSGSARPVEPAGPTQAEKGAAVAAEIERLLAERGPVRSDVGDAAGDVV